MPKPRVGTAETPQPFTGWGVFRDFYDQLSAVASNVAGCARL